MAQCAAAGASISAAAAAVRQIQGHAAVVQRPDAACSQDPSLHAETKYLMSPIKGGSTLPANYLR